MKIRTTLLAVAALLPAAGAQSPLLTIPAPASSVDFAETIAGVGDVNGDGFDDIAVGDNGWNQAAFHGGIVRIYSGLNGALLNTFTGPANSHLGGSVAGVGDVDGDGKADVVIGASSNDTIGLDAGMAFIAGGATGAGLKTFYGTAAGDHFGAAVCSAGDLDFDGIEDVAIGAPDASFGILDEVGGVRVYSSITGNVLLSLKGSQKDARFGASLDGAGDVDGDGMPDLVIGAYGFNGANTNQGRVEVRSGSDGHVIFSRDGQSTTSYGYTVAGLGDLNADGFADVAVGEPSANGGQGRVEVLLGPTGTLTWTREGNAVNDQFGISVDGPGDLDKDGFADLIVGADGAPTDFGYFRIYSGRTGGVLYATVYGDSTGDEFGRCAVGAGDLNGDGWLDIAVGANPYQSADLGYLRTFDVLFKAPNLGSGGPGSATLSMYGSPLGSFGEMDLLLKNAAPNKPAFLIASLGALNAPFKGGVLVPNVGAGLLVPLATNAQGKLLIPGIAGGSGPFSVYVQCLIQDPAQPKGWALSNAIKPQFLP